MVMVPKKSGAIILCVDLKKLNESALREVHPMPKVDESLALLAGATIFPSSMPIVGFGIFLLPKILATLQHLKPHLGGIGLKNCLLASQAPKTISEANEENS